jgi:di/tricarboxylate transporter
MPEQYNIQTGENQKVQVTTELPDERLARLAKERRQHLFDLWVRGMLFILLTLGAVYSLWALNNPNSTQEMKDIARAIIGAVLGAFTGYFAGKTS